MKKTPLEQAKERFKILEKEPKAARIAAKKELIEAIRAFEKGGLWVSRLNEDKGLERVSNRKLLHLLDTLSSVKDAFGDRDKLIGEIAKIEKRDKDPGFRNRLEKHSTARLWDHYQAAQKRVAVSA